MRLPWRRAGARWAVGDEPAVVEELEPDPIQRLLTSLSELERGQASNLTRRVVIGTDRLRVTLADDTEVQLAADSSAADGAAADGVAAAVRAVRPDIRPPLSDETHYPFDDHSRHMQWTELLRDCAIFLRSAGDRLELHEIRDEGDHAMLAVTDAGRPREFPVSLEGAEHPAAVLVDIAIECQEDG